jgi:hypothetical protein
MIIYIDDIFVYSKTMEEHAEHLEYVLNKLHENKLSANKVKNEFDEKEMDFLKHILLREGVRLDPTKLQAIRDWKRLVTIKRIGSFLGLANCYWKFIKRFSQMAKLLLDLF